MGKGREGQGEEGGTQKVLRLPPPVAVPPLQPLLPSLLLAWPGSRGGGHCPRATAEGGTWLAAAGKLALRGAPAPS